MQRLVSQLRPSVIASSAVAAAGLHFSPSTRCQEPGVKPTGREHPDRLSVFGLGDIPSSAYKAHFSDAHNAAAEESAANVARRNFCKQEGESASEKEMRKGIASLLMQKLGYTEQELQFLGDDILRMQGVRSPFPFAALRPGEVVVDLGSGFGPDAFLAASKVGEGGHVVGVNLSAGEVQHSRRRAEERGLKRCEFAEADMEATALTSDSADIVISNGGFCLCPNKRLAFQEVHRILRPGGRMAISCTVLRKPLPPLEGKRWPPCMEVFMKRGEVESLLGELGFESVVVDESHSRMDVWDLDSMDLDTVAYNLGSAPNTAPQASMCSHARKAAERRGREQVETFLSKDREAGIHWGNPQFEHVQDFDMNELCARVVICAEKQS